MINVRNDRKISDVIHQRERLSAWKYCEQRYDHSRWNIKKGASVCDAPWTNNLWQLLCWIFIVGKKPDPDSPKTAIFLSLQGSNINFIHKLFTIYDRPLWTTCGRAVDQQVITQDSEHLWILIGFIYLKYQKITPDYNKDTHYASKFVSDHKQ